MMIQSDNSMEIELKMYIGGSADSLISTLQGLGWKQIERGEQQDTYYTSKHRDFIDTEECLRVRITPTLEQLTWKPPTSEVMRTQVQRWKQELDINITGQSQNVKRLLQQLDFIEYVTVKKHRMAFRVDESSSVALDLVEPLGWFIEIETFGEVADVGIQKNNEIARLLHIEHCQRINVPYRDIVKAGRVDFVAR